MGEREFYRFITIGTRGEVLSSITDILQYERPVGQVTLLKSLYLQNFTSDYNAVSTEGYIKVKPIKMAATGLDSFRGST